MDKEIELKAFYSVYGIDHSLEILPHEKPDILVKSKGKIRLGVEVTEIYSHETDAKLKNLNGYSLGLINGTMHVHKKDKEYIKVDEATLLDKDGNEKGKFMAILQEMPGFKDRVTILENAITDKENKMSSHLVSCEVMDLIVLDSSNLFHHDGFEEFYRPYSRFYHKGKLLGSLFREIFLVTTKKDNAKIFIPLKGNMFLSDCFAYEMFLREDGITKNSTKEIIETLLASLYLSGYTNLIISTNEDEFGIHFGPWEMHYSRTGKSIRDRAMLFDDVEAMAIDVLVNGFSENATDRAKFLVERRSTVFSAMEFFVPVKIAKGA